MMSDVEKELYIDDLVDASIDKAEELNTVREELKNYIELIDDTVQVCIENRDESSSIDLRQLSSSIKSASASVDLALSVLIDRILRIDTDFGSEVE